MSNGKVSLGQNDIVILVHTQSYIENERAISYFQNASKLPGIQILYMPLLKGVTDRIITAKYKHHVEGRIAYTELETSKLCTMINTYSEVLGEINEQNCNEYAEKSLLRGKCRSVLFDYIIAENQEATNIFDCDVHVISLAECKEMLRLLLVSRNDFFINEHFSIHEFTYYIYRHKRMFPAFQAFWEAACKSLPDNWAEALDTRLDLISRSFDQCKICACWKMDNNTVMHLKYHFSYLLLLITGTLDNLAWIVNELYDLGFDESTKHRVDLRGYAYKTALEEHAGAIYNITTDTLFVARLNMIRNMRDRIVHRDFLQAYRGGKANGKREICYLNTKRSTYNEIQDAGYKNDKYVIKTNDDVLVNMFSFIEFLERITVEMVNSLISVIAKEKFRREDTVVVWKLLGFPCEPYVL